ncbi:MAG: sulfatase-like hydrolase/transferase [Micropruina sp.]
MTARPNVVLIVADDMGYGDFGFVNGGLNATPALDRLAADGVVFGTHYAAAPVCAPAGGLHRAGTLQRTASW